MHTDHTYKSYIQIIHTYAHTYIHRYPWWTDARPGTVIVGNNTFDCRTEHELHEEIHALREAGLLHKSDSDSDAARHDENHAVPREEPSSLTDVSEMSQTTYFQQLTQKIEQDQQARAELADRLASHQTHGFASETPAQQATMADYFLQKNVQINATAVKDSPGTSMSYGPSVPVTISAGHADAARAHSQLGLRRDAEANPNLYNASTVGQEGVGSTQLRDHMEDEAHTRAAGCAESRTHDALHAAGADTKRANKSQDAVESLPTSSKDMRTSQGNEPNSAYNASREVLRPFKGVRVESFVEMNKNKSADRPLEKSYRIHIGGSDEEPSSLTSLEQNESSLPSGSSRRTCMCVHTYVCICTGMYVRRMGFFFHGSDSCAFVSSWVMRMCMRIYIYCFICMSMRMCMRIRMFDMYVCAYVYVYVYVGYVCV